MNIFEFAMFTKQWGSNNLTLTHALPCDKFESSNDPLKSIMGLITCAIMFEGRNEPCRLVSFLPFQKDGKDSIIMFHHMSQFLLPEPHPRMVGLDLNLHFPAKNLVNGLVLFVKQRNFGNPGLHIIKQLGHFSHWSCNSLLTLKDILYSLDSKPPSKVSPPLCIMYF